jgi:catechol 2,3-dioxygenase-like lactoylglutathione lyase family enzyme
MLLKLDYIEVLEEDWPATIQWYTEKLGLQIKDRDDVKQWCQL